MSSSHTPTAEDSSAQHIKREDALRRSLRDCTTRRLTHFFPCDVKKPQSTPLLTSRVQWNVERADSDDVPVSDDDDDDDDDLKHIDAKVEHSMPSPVQSEMDVLTTSDDSHSPSNGRLSNGAYSVARGSYEHHRTMPEDRGSARLYSDSSDTEKRQPSFPGNRDIIDSKFPSSSPSPPTQHSTEIETPSPVSDAPRNWRPSYSQDSSSLDLRLFPKNRTQSKDDKNNRIGLWCVGSSPQGYPSEDTTNERYDSTRLSRSSRDSCMTYSPSISAASTPPSPPHVLPPIRHLNATIPVNTGRTPGVLHWRFRDSISAANHKRLSPYMHDSADEYDTANTASSSGSPQVLPPLLPHILAQSYPPRMQLPPMIPMSVAQPPTNPTRNKNAWKEHAQLIMGPNDQTEFRCVWRVGYAGEMTDLCGYTAKRHLVKRHIETRHLQFKYAYLYVIALSNLLAQNLIRANMPTVTRRSVILHGGISTWLR
ncbi:hypothetical protein DFH11DRAFT_1797955, partial [Phellopilus nigrolimitatus]